MRVVQPLQTELGEMNIADIEFDIKSRDDIPQILRGLQFIYTQEDVRLAVVALLEEHIQPNRSNATGRPGMSLWNILVMGMLRLDLNWDYDRLLEQVNSHITIRQMLGHADLFDKHRYNYQTVKDNVSLLAPELLDKVNQVVVDSGHAMLKRGDQVLRCRCDSFVVETNVHYPTDLNLLYNAMRKTIQLTAKLCETHELDGWRQSSYNIKQVKRRMRKVQQATRGGGGSEKQQSGHQERIEKSCTDYIERCGEYIEKASTTLETLENTAHLGVVNCIAVSEIRVFIEHANRQMDQIGRRLLKFEKIPHEEKVFSLFEPHTEWISKGKAGVPVELGLKVCIMEDQYGLILHYQVMEKKTDSDVAVSMVKESQERFAQLSTCSFDKGFHSPGNQEELGELLDVVALPRKGKRSKKATEWENSDAFKQAKHKHSAVESAINALEVHGLDRCPDHGLDGMKRYVALSIVSRNVQRIGAILLASERKQQERKRRKKAA